jgi:hypothetical protein
VKASLLQLALIKMRRRGVRSRSDVPWNVRQVDEARTGQLMRRGDQRSSARDDRARRLKHVGTGELIEKVAIAPLWPSVRGGVWENDANDVLSL